MLAQLLFSVFFNISPIGGRFPIFQQQPQITGFLVLDCILSKNIKDQKIPNVVKNQRDLGLDFHLLDLETIKEISEN